MNENQFKKSLKNIDLTNVNNITENEQLNKLVGKRIISIERSHAIKLLLIGLFGILLVALLYYLLFEVLSVKSNIIVVPIGLLFLCVAFICNSILKIFNTFQLLLIGLFGILFVALLYYLLFEVLSVNPGYVVIPFGLLFIFIVFIGYSLLEIFNKFKKKA